MSYSFSISGSQFIERVQDNSSQRQFGPGQLGPTKTRTEITQTSSQDNSDQFIRQLEPVHKTTRPNSEDISRDRKDILRIYPLNPLPQLGPIQKTFRRKVLVVYIVDPLTLY